MSENATEKAKGTCFGVCAYFANRTGIDVIIIRILLIFLFVLYSGNVALIYILLALFVTEEK